MTCPYCHSESVVEILPPLLQARRYQCRRCRRRFSGDPPDLFARKDDTAKSAKPKRPKGKPSTLNAGPSTNP